MTNLEKNIIGHIVFNRLHDIYQNSTAYLTFPSNRTKRFEHSIGVMHLSSKMFTYSLQNTENDIIQKMYSDSLEVFNFIFKIMNNDPSNGIYLNKRSLTFSVENFLEYDFKYENYELNLLPNNVIQDVKYKNLFYILLQAIRVAGLLHDIGHPPYSHIVERALKKIYTDYEAKENLNEKEKKFIDETKDYFGKKTNEKTNRQPHEKIGDDLTRIIIKDNLIDKTMPEPLLYKNVQILFIYYIVNYIYNSDILYSINTYNFNKNKTVKYFSFLHSFIAGALDSDRLDYVSRDLMNSGLCGIIEYERLFLNMKLFTFIAEDKTELFYFAVHEKTRNNIEDFLKKRLKLYKDVLYHHRVQKTDFLLSNCVERIIREWLNDETNDLNINEIEKLWEPLTKCFVNDKIDSLTQWNDSWLLTVLKRIYLSKYENDPLEDEHKIIKSQLEELLKNRKYYYSLIKRRDEFLILDSTAKDTFFSHQNEFDKLFSRIDKKDEEEEKDSKSQLRIMIKEKLIEIRKKNNFINNMKILEFPLVGKEQYNTFLKTIVEIKYDELFDIIFIRKDLTSGIATKDELSNTEFSYETIYFYNDNESKKSSYSIQEQENEFIDILNAEIINSPSIYIYVFPKISEDNLEEKRIDLLKQIGHNIGEGLSNKIIEILSTKC